MTRKLLIKFGIVALTLSLFAPVVVASNLEAHAAESEEVETCSNYVWVYKEVDGKKYMRLYDRSRFVYVTDWILVE